MMKEIKSIVVSLAMCSMLVTTADASDLQREKRMSDEIVDTILDGDAVFLEADNHKFLSIYTEAEEPKGAVIILHGRGFHPDWQDAINPLRVGLSESGWNTLSAQMPVLEKEAKYFDYVPLFPASFPRIEAAIDYAREQGNEKIVLLAHSCGVHMALSWVDSLNLKDDEQPIDAFIGLGMGATDYQQPMVKPFPFEKLAVPILDVYGEDDYPAVLREAPNRLRGIKAAGNEKTRQLVIDGANHYYEDKGDELTEKVSQWLQTL